MGRKALLAVVCWLTLSQTFGDQKTLSPAVQDNESAESAPRRLYRNVPVGMYASAAPHAAYSFHLPTFIAAPDAAASQAVPVKENYMNRLTDSYGNRYVGTPQLSAYKIAVPQQFVALQSKLPEHLAQPLVAASANFQFKQSNGHFFGAPYRVPSLQGPVPTPLHHFPTFGELYGDKVKSLAPNAVVHSQAWGIPKLHQHQQSTNNKAVFANTQSHEKFNDYKEEPKVSHKKEPEIIVGKSKAQDYQDDHGESKYQRVQDLPHYENKFQIIQDGPYSPQYQRIQEHQSPHGEVKFQRLEDAPDADIQHNYDDKSKHARPGENSQISQNNKAKLQSAPNKQIVTYINDINGEKTIVELDTKPKVPLLDLTLLEPLTFDNPLVPQVQHFLPRINQATYQKLPELNVPVVKNYQKEFMVQKTTSYDSGKQHKEAPRKKQKKPSQHNKYAKNNDTPKKTIVTHHETLDDAPEITYEIGSPFQPNYRETVSQKAVSYNRETQSEPVHYTYGSNNAKKPVTYSYSRTSKEPAQIQNVQYSGKGPSHLIYNFKPEEQAHEGQSHDAEDEDESDNSSHESHDDGSAPQHHHHTGQYKEHPQSSEEHHEAPRPEKGNYQKGNEDKSQEIVHDNPNPNSNPNPKYQSEPVHIKSENINFQPILKEYENNIRSLTEPSASIKVDPSQHVQHHKSNPQQHGDHREEHSQPQQQQKHQHSSSGSHEHHHSAPEPQRHHNHQHSSAESSEYPHPSPQSHNHHHLSNPHSNIYNVPAHIHEKSKRIIVKEESPNEMHMLTEQMRAEVIKREENSEEDFEKAYKDAAIGFPAYSDKASDSERDIFDPESYGVPREHIEYEFESTPFQQYQGEGDSFPKETRSRYKDSKDKMKQDYYSDYSISKPTSLLDRYQNKLGYYKLFKQQKPDYLTDDGNSDKKEQQKSAKYTAAPSYDYHPAQDKGKSYYTHPKPKQQLYEYDYSKGTPRDSSAYASRPYQNYKSRTSFVEPQFQYGFEPLALPKLLDSELAAMASNDSPESEKPGMRKKIYKENWYIKKTSTSAGAPAS